MKKVLAIAFIGGLVLASCTKKETTDMDAVATDSATVVAPDSTLVDSAAVVAPVVTDSAATDSTVTK